MEKIYWSELDDKQRRVVEQMAMMTEEQKDCFLRFLECLAQDNALSVALEKNLPLVRAFIRAGNLRGFDRLIRRQTIKAVK